MADCCDHDHAHLDVLVKRQRHVLWILLVLNFIMFIVEFVASFNASSVSLAADALDMLSDALTYASTIYALQKATETKVRIAKWKGFLMVGTALFVFAKAVYAFIRPEIPDTFVMSTIAAAAFAVNGFCLLLLSRYRSQDINMRSVWLCSRNDLLANLGVLIGAWLVFKTQSVWPDLAIGLLITYIVAKSGLDVLRETKIALN